MQLEDGRVITADENYIRESILTPGAKIVSGFKPIMPVFQGLVSEEQLNALVAYVKSLNPSPSGAAGGPAVVPSGAKPQETKGAIAMATAAITAERENYLNQEYGIKSWLLTVDHKRIALLYLLSITFFFFIGGFFALLIRLELLTPAGDLVQADTYNKLFTMHGQVMVFFFLIPSIPAVLGNFLVPLMIGAKDLAFPRINLAELVSVHHRRRSDAALHAHRRRGHGLDFLHALQHRLQQHQGDRGRAGHLHLGILLDPDRTEFRGHHPPHAGPGHDLGPFASVHLGALRHQHHPVAGDARDRGHAGAGGSRTGSSPRDLRSRRGAATRFCSSTCSGSIPIPPSTS